MDEIEKANKVFLQNFPAETWFERAILFSWYCKIRNCKFCYMSTQPDKKTAVRSKESLIAEAVICKNLGWEIGAFSGGIDAYSQADFKEIIKNVSNVCGKLWLNVGALGEKEIKEYLPYTKGVVASIETVNPKLHDFVCPSKPTAPYEKMLGTAGKYNLKKAMTIILGLGETIEDFELLKNFIEKHKIDKIYFYSLNPQKGTVFENKEMPSAEYQAEWIAKTRIAFPKIEILAGIWLNKVDRVPLLLKAGANSISKFPALKAFGSKEAKKVEEGARKAGRKFKGTLTKLPKINWNEEVEKLNLEKNLKEKVNKKLNSYLSRLTHT